METSNSDASSLDSSASISSSSVNGGSSRTTRFPLIRLLQSPISSLLEYSGVLRVRPDYPYSEARPLMSENGEVNDRSVGNIQGTRNSGSINGDVDVDGAVSSSSSRGEVSIRIIGEQDRVGVVNSGENGEGSGAGSSADESMVPLEGVNGNGSNSNSDDNSSNNQNREASAYQRYDIQQVARWVEQILPFSLLLLVVFIRQHFQGFFGVIWITAVLYKSNDILRKQTALKRERKISVLAGYSLVFLLHVFGIYWWYRKDDLYYSLVMIPPKATPPFWHAIFIILVNDAMVSQTAMVLKLILLMYYKDGRGHNFRRQGQLLTVIEYMLLLYRALLPTPVWYRFFLNKEYGSLFSSLTTGLYLTFKLTSIVEKVRSFVAALKALSRKDIHYGSYATSEQVNAAGDLCAICQEKMHAPILLRCKHIFCEDCVSEWFERERTCPLCRALVRPADLRSYGDGSTTLLFQLF
ncbi:RING finger and transmembrane domain-containing protein 2-like [Dorcoceras hygrometricum]|uniref:RING finger and transmembrane domain-containing protein 2-like n=1 Tax=Dorcoceras hygrometricum TaxID=472368 RepID=A0A2Z7BMT9_9LAMI|nr:RING finger and transmembrane domain-containing protein 2-like [Dorcoceras hygrometricum]